MATLHATKGLPGCGKTTAALKYIADDPTVVRVNRDDLRFMLFGVYWGPPIDEEVVTVAQYAAIDAALRAGRDVFVDDTNLSPDVQERLLNAAKSVEGAHIMWHDFTDVPLCVCIERDAHRERQVGPAVIRGMWEKYLK
jgi:predicted kinase